MLDTWLKPEEFSEAPGIRKGELGLWRASWVTGPLEILLRAANALLSRATLDREVPPP